MVFLTPDSGVKYDSNLYDFIELGGARNDTRIDVHILVIVQSRNPRNLIINYEEHDVAQIDMFAKPRVRACLRVREAEAPWLHGIWACRRRMSPNP